MIVVLLGTNPYSFSRLAKAVDIYAAKYNEKIFIQLGYTDYLPVNATYERFLDKKDLLKMINDAELIITQGGFGSIADCLKAGKKVVAVPRKPEFKEAPDRQEEVVREFERLGRLVGLYDIDNLPEAIEKAKLLAVKQEQKNKIDLIIYQFIMSMEKKDN